MTVMLLRLLREALGKKTEARSLVDDEAVEGGTDVAPHNPLLPSEAPVLSQTALPILIPPPRRRSPSPPSPSPETLRHLFAHVEQRYGRSPSAPASLASSPVPPFPRSPSTPAGDGFSTFLREFRQQMDLDDPEPIEDEPEERAPSSSSQHSSWQGSSTYRDGCCSSIHTHVQDLVGRFSDEEPLVKEDAEDDCDDESDSESFRCRTAAAI